MNIPQPVTEIQYQRNPGKPKLGFIALNFNFLADLIPLLAQDFDICFPANRENIIDFANEMDVLWFEFAYGDLFRELVDTRTRAKKVVRVHKFEIYQDDIYQVDWDNIDLAFFVNDYCLKLFRKNYYERQDKTYGSCNWNTRPVSMRKLRILPNGIDISRFDDAYKYEKTTSEKNTVGLLGYITPVKNLPFALQIFDRLYYTTKIFDLDKWKFKIGGCFLDKMTEDYFYHYLDLRKLNSAVEFVGWVKREEVPDFMKSVNYMLCTSYSESQNVSCVEAMASGIRPVIHYFPGAGTVWNSGLFTTIESALTQFVYADENTSSPYSSAYYRELAKEKFDVRKQAEIFKKEMEMKLNVLC